MWSFRRSSDKKHCYSSRAALPQLTEAFLLPHGFKPVVILATFSFRAAPWAVNLRFWPFRVLKPEVNIRMMALDIQVSLSVPIVWPSSESRSLCLAAVSLP